MRLIILLALAVISHQQFEQQRRLVWWYPDSQQPFFTNYISHHDYNFRDADTQIIGQHYTPNRPITYFQDEDTGIIKQYAIGESEIPPGQPRIKGIKGIARFPPSPFDQHQGQSPRFFISLINGNTIANPFFRTFTFTVTSSVTVATVQSCISSNQFASGSQNVACRRKRHQADESLDEDSPIPIAASQVLQMVPTELATLDAHQKSRQLPLAHQHKIISSIDEDILGEKPGLTTLSRRYSREKRFFRLKYVAFTTVISYSFITTTITKAVQLIKTTSSGGTTTTTTTTATTTTTTTATTTTTTTATTTTTTATTTDNPTTTATTTSATDTTTASTSTTFTRANEVELTNRANDDAQLICLPAGYVVCA